MTADASDFSVEVDGDRIAYTHLIGADPDAPGIFFLPGFRSNRSGLKANYLRDLAVARGWAFTALDYCGHGDSTGCFETADVTRWCRDTLSVLQAVPPIDHILVGSSMGAWIAVNLARTAPQQVRGLVTVAAAPDFTEDLMLPSFTQTQRDSLAAGQTLYRPSAYGDGPYPITPMLIEGSRASLVLREPINLDIPLHALHGECDTDVPISQSEKLIAVWHGGDTKLTRIPDGDHRLSHDQDLALLENAVDHLMARAAASNRP